MKFKRYLTELDLLAPQISLKIHGRSAVKTVFGSILWILAAGGFIASLTLAMHQFFSRDDPRMFEQKSSSTTYPKFHLSQGLLVPIIMPLYLETQVIPFEEVSKFVTFIARRIKYEGVMLPDGNFIFNYTEAVMPFVLCGNLSGSNRLSSSIVSKSLGQFDDWFYKIALCIDSKEEDLFVEGRVNDNSFTAFEVSILPCSLADQNQCKPMSEVSKMSFIYLTGQETLNFGNYEQPLSYSFNGDEFYYIDLGITNRVTQKLMKTEITDVHSFLQPDSLRISYPKIEQSYLQFLSRDPTQTTCTKEQIASAECKPYFTRIFQSGGTLNKITRTYKGVVETMGDIGGARDTIFMIAMLLYGWHNERCKRKLLLESVLGLKSIPPRHQTKEEKKNLSEIEEKSFDNIEDCLDIITI